MFEKPRACGLPCPSLSAMLWVCGSGDLSFTVSVTCISLLYTHMYGHMYTLFKAGPRSICSPRRICRGVSKVRRTDDRHSRTRCSVTFLSSLRGSMVHVLISWMVGNLFVRDLEIFYFFLQKKYISIKKNLGNIKNLRHKE